ncbi:MAG: PhnD/SsuA/transferrin family substrate-binding protein [Methylovulum sp.]|nr:PhnD/SsuA/transferrin family substrate-binding protein [Methylovulum sp.]
MSQALKLKIATVYGDDKLHEFNVSGQLDAGAVSVIGTLASQSEPNNGRDVMTQAPNLTIATVHSDDTLHEFKLSGQIDVSAGPVIDALANNKLLASSRVILDFAEVDRINSMGLAQLMKVLEKWRAQTIKIEARNLNRVLSMLFKMTGLNRYFNDMPESATAKKSAEPRDNTVKLRQVKRIRPVAEPVNGNKLDFLVSLQNSQQLAGWYVFNTFLQRHLEKAIHIDVKQPDLAIPLSQHALVFAKPFDACTLISKYQFIPVARPMNETDEVSIVVRKNGSPKTIAEFLAATVVTASETDFIYVLGQFLCDECGLASSGLHYTFTGNDIKALQTLLRGQADMLFMPKRNYHQLSRLSREDTCLLEESETAMAYPMLLLSPSHAGLQKKLADTLLAMQDDDKSRQILADLGLDGWCLPEQAELDMLLMLYNRYAKEGAAEY